MGRADSPQEGDDAQLHSSPGASLVSKDRRPSQAAAEAVTAGC
jgi:hypothetical protein